MDEALRNILRDISTLKDLVYLIDDYDTNKDYYEPILEQLNEAQDAVRGAIALT